MRIWIDIEADMGSHDGPGNEISKRQPRRAPAQCEVAEIELVPMPRPVRLQLGAVFAITVVADLQHMLPWLFIIDDFLQRPDLVRARALQLNYAVPGPYPGLNSVERIGVKGLVEVISAIVQEPLEAPWTAQLSHQNCRLSLASDSGPGRVHVDPSDWTGVLSLSRDEDSHGGTEFFRHRRTGTHHLPTDRQALSAAGYGSFRELDEDILQKDSLDPTKWDQTFTVPLRFNRLMLMRPHYWHTAGPGFGDSVENGRLVYLMFFKRIRAADDPAPPRPHA